MIRLRFLVRAALMIAAPLTLASCNRATTDLPAMAPATQVVVSDYTGTSKNPYVATKWTITNAKSVARLASLADAQGKSWRDANSATMSIQTGIELKFSGGGVNQIFTVYYPGGFDNSFNTAPGNLWSRPDYVGPSTVIKEVSEAEIDQMLAGIRAEVKGVKPDATPRPTATPKAMAKAAPTATAARKAK